MTEFRTSFEVTADPAEAWQALEALRAEHGNDIGAPNQWWLPAFETTGTEVDVEPGRALTVRKDTAPCAGTLIAITFEHVGTGARITVVQSGFDEAFVEAAGDKFWNVANQYAVELERFFSTASHA